MLRIALAFFAITTFSSPLFAQSFVLPIGGIPYKDWTIVNYTDKDFSSGVIDWNGGNYAYDGHDAIDFTLPNFSAMDAGVPVFAAQSGTVTYTHDGEFDRWSRVNPNPGFQSNSIIISHGNGITTSYLHLRKNSITVSTGDTVTAGQQIALVGSSGYSSDAHLHFTVRQNGTTVETYDNPSYWWQNPLPYAGDVPDVLDFGVVDHYLTTTELVDRPLEAGVFDLQEGSGQLVVAWANVHGFNNGDTVEYFFYRPNGSQYTHYTWTSNETRYGWWDAAITLPNNAETGTWSITAKHNGVTLLQDSFFVIDSNLPVPDQPVTISPVNRSEVPPNTPIPVAFNEASPSVTEYQLQRYDRVTNAWNYVARHDAAAICSAGTCNTTVAGLAPQLYAAWRVRGLNSSGWGPWSVNAVFNVVTPNLPLPGKPSVQSPKNGATVAPNTPISMSFSTATEAVTRYQIQRYDRIAQRWNFLRTYNAGNICTGNTCTTQTPGMSVQNYAVWRVRAYNATGWGSWSTNAVFNVSSIPTTVPPKPVALSPINFVYVAANTPVNVTFGDVGASATRYQLQRFDRSVNRWSYVAVESASNICSNNVCATTVAGVSPQKYAVWRVRAYNSLGWGAWSDNAVFNTQ